MTFVASKVPPIPTSSTTVSHFLRRKYSKAMQHTSSNSVGDSFMESVRGLTYSVTATNSSSVISTPSTCIEILYEPKPDDRLFSLSKSYLYRKMEQGSKAMGLQRIRVHDLWHSHVSLLIHMGYSAVAIAERMGHESIDITFRYAHLFPTVQRQMAADLNALQEGGDENVC